MRVKNEIINFLMITAGAIIAAFAIEDFLVPDRIFDGGLVGVAMIVSSFTHIKLSLLTWLLNAPFLILAWKKKGKLFVIRSVYAMTVFSVSMIFFEKTPAVTNDHLLAVTFGGLILGVGVGLVLRYGGCLDGTEI
ncbi:MAG: YitT family protein, partial [Eubacterium sp.]|nr:YitT family protein [Eubacterium sp.]